MMITLTTWAERTFAPSPKIATLRQWAKTGQITPQPVKVGRAWMVEETARYTPLQLGGEPVSARARRILDDAAAA